MGRRPLVRVRARFKERLHQVQVAGLLLPERLRLGIPGPEGPFDVQRREQRTHAVVADHVRIRACVEQVLGQIVVAVDDRYQHRAGLVPTGDVVHVGSAGDQGLSSLAVALAGREVESREPTLLPYLLGVALVAVVGGVGFLLHHFEVLVLVLLVVLLFFLVVFRLRLLCRLSDPCSALHLPGGDAVEGLVVLDPGLQLGVGTRLKQGSHGG